MILYIAREGIQFFFIYKTRVLIPTQILIASLRRRLNAEFLIVENCNYQDRSSVVHENVHVPLCFCGFHLVGVIQLNEMKNGAYCVFAEMALLSLSQARAYTIERQISSMRLCHDVPFHRCSDEDNRSLLAQLRLFETKFVIFSSMRLINNVLWIYWIWWIKKYRCNYFLLSFHCFSTRDVLWPPVFILQSVSFNVFRLATKLYIH